MHFFLVAVPRPGPHGHVRVGAFEFETHWQSELIQVGRRAGRWTPSSYRSLRLRLPGLVGAVRARTGQGLTGRLLG